MISIHAPAKGATLLKCSSRSDGRDFNPRSREGSDHDKGRCEGNGDDFNPRSREGSDPATPPSWKIQRDFNPRSREGSDTTTWQPRQTSYNFNPRSREGSDCISSFTAHSLADFNPRSREGSDSLVCGIYDGSDISIHAPAKGATSRKCSSLIWQSFQSTLPRRERQRRSTDWGNGRNFNPRSREGSDG